MIQALRTILIAVQNDLTNARSQQQQTEVLLAKIVNKMETTISKTSFGGGTLRPYSISLQRHVTWHTHAQHPTPKHLNLQDTHIQTCLSFIFLVSCHIAHSEASTPSRRRDTRSTSEVRPDCTLQPAWFRVLPLKTDNGIWWGNWQNVRQHLLLNQRPMDSTHHSLST